MGSRKDWVQPRRVMKGRPRMTVVLQAYRAISPNWSRKTEGSRRKVYQCLSAEYVKIPLIGEQMKWLNK